MLRLAQITCMSYTKKLADHDCIVLLYATAGCSTTESNDLACKATTSQNKTSECSKTAGVSICWVHPAWLQFAVSYNKQISYSETAGLLNNRVEKAVREVWCQAPKQAVCAIRLTGQSSSNNLVRSPSCCACCATTDCHCQFGKVAAAAHWVVMGFLT